MAVAIGNKNVGDIVKLRENGALVEFIVVHKGLPPTYYDASCDGVWVLRKLVYPDYLITPISGDGNYAQSQAKSWMENTYYNMFDSAAKMGIKNVRIPYMYGNGTIAIGASGALGHCFSLAYNEVGVPIRYNNFASKLSYFANCDGNNDRPERAADNHWLTRDTIKDDGSARFGQIYKSGYGGSETGDNAGLKLYVRPAMILNYNMLVNDDGSITVNTAPSTPGSISVPGSMQGGTAITVSWSASSDAQGNLEGYKLERSLNGGAWSQIYQGGGTSTANHVAYGTNTVAYRVKAYDNMGAESGYRTSAAVTVINNTPPGAPQGITVPANIRGGNPVTISWGAGADAENNLAGYELERSVNGGTWAQIFRGAQRSHTDNVTFGWRTVAYRVRAYDAYNAYSGYATSEAVAVDNNRPPEIVCAFRTGSDLGIKSGGFSVSYTVNDADNRTGEVTVTENLDGAKKKEFRPELGKENTFTSDGVEFQCLPNGKHTILFSAGDGKASCTHTLTFTKSVTSALITLVTPMDADDRIEACAVAASGYIPEDALYRVLVTNNAKDAEPAWEDCTQAVKNGANHIFANKSAENGFAFNFKITVSRGESGAGGYITSIQGGFQ